LCFDKEATAFYASLFADSKVENIRTITGTPSGDCDIVTFYLSGQEFMVISAGPYFKFNPSIFKEYAVATSVLTSYATLR